MGEHSEAVLQNDFLQTVVWVVTGASVAEHLPELGLTLGMDITRLFLLWHPSNCILHVPSPVIAGVRALRHRGLCQGLCLILLHSHQ